MKKQIPLQWTLGKENGSGEEPTDWIPATVPGAVQLDFAAAKNYLPYTYAENYEQFDWMEDCWFRYRAVLPAGITPELLPYLVSKGIDYRFRILVNGNKVLEHEGMFSPVEVPLASYLTDGENLVDVELFPIPKRAGAPANRQQADQSCKFAVGYGWDFHPRMVSSGIWNDIYVELRREPVIMDCQVLTALDKDLETGHLSGTLHTSRAAGQSVSWKLLDPNGHAVLQGASIIGVDETLTVNETLCHPHLWWPNGYGEAALYTFHAELTDGRTCWDTVDEKRGFRQIRLLLNSGVTDGNSFPKSRMEAPITFTVNGKRLFAQGTNWVCPTMFPGTLTADVYAAQLDLIQKANMNLVRCWGGAVVNKESFFELCDERGLMVWQEFPLACNCYGDTPAYLKVLDQESTAIIRRLRRHACLAVWCGGNELFNSWSGMTDQSIPLRLLNRNCLQLDMHTPFIMTAPLNGMGHGGYMFSAEVGEDLFQCINRSHRTAYSEFGCPSAGDMETLRQTIPPEQLSTPCEGKSWETHFAINAWQPDSWLNLLAIRRYFPDIRETEDVVRESQEMQAVGYQYFFEEARRQWPYCSVAMNWCFNEPFPCAANNAVVGYDGHIKPSYGTICKALRHTLLSVRIPRFDSAAGEEVSWEIWLLSDAPCEDVGHVRYWIETEEGKTAFKTLQPEETTSKGNRCLGKLTLTLPQTEGVWYTLHVNSDRHREWNSTYRLRTRAANTAENGRRL